MFTDIKEIIRLYKEYKARKKFKKQIDYMQANICPVGDFHEWEETIIMTGRDASSIGGDQGYRCVKCGKEKPW